ncbi:MAG: DUF983 domain-containing protein [Hyphomicrobiaceae bacterium]
MPIENQASELPAGDPAHRDVWSAMKRGGALKCPACGKGRMFRAYLKVADTCPACGEALHHQRADDAPAYVTMVIVGHVIVGGILMLEKSAAPPTWVHLAIWLPLMTAMTLLLLPVCKGALVALQWALRMHGFGGTADVPEPDPAAPITVGKGDPRP